MKATELMIGDWVGRVFDDKRIEYRQVDWIRTGEIGMRYQKVWAIGCIEPIPLTPEILEKNGFVQEDDAYMDDIAYKCFCEILTGHYSANDIIVSYDGSKEFTITNDLGYPCDEITLYRPKVHELQHALRLCGLNELADNFKV